VVAITIASTELTIIYIPWVSALIVEISAKAIEPRITPAKDMT